MVRRCRHSRADTLAEPIETWWPAIEVFLTTGLTKARSDCTNWIKQVKRANSGFRNRENATPSALALHPAHLPLPARNLMFPCLP